MRSKHSQSQIPRPSFMLKMCHLDLLLGQFQFDFIYLLIGIYPPSLPRFHISFLTSFKNAKINLFFIWLPYSIFAYVIFQLVLPFELVSRFIPFLNVHLFFYSNWGLYKTIGILVVYGDEWDSEKGGFWWWMRLKKILAFTINIWYCLGVVGHAPF